MAMENDCLSLVVFRGPSHPRTDDGSIESGDCVRIQINVLDL